MYQQSGQLQRWLALVRERAAHRQTVAANCDGFLILTLGYVPFDLAHAFDILLEFCLGMMISFGDWLGRLFEIVELAQLVRNVGQDLLHRQADRTLRIRDDTMDRYRQRLLDRAQQVGQVGLAGTVEAAGQQDFA